MTNAVRKATRLVAHYQSLIDDIEAQLPASYKGSFSLQDGQITRSNTPPDVFRLLELREKYWNLMNEQQDIIDGYGSSSCFRIGGIYG